MYAFYKHEGNLELITTANLPVGMSYIMLEWSRRIINMLLYENGEILTLVNIGVTLATRVTAMLTRVNISPYSYNHNVTHKNSQIQRQRYRQR